MPVRHPRCYSTYTRPGGEKPLGSDLDHRRSAAALDASAFGRARSGLLARRHGRRRALPVRGRLRRHVALHRDRARGARRLGPAGRAGPRRRRARGTAFSVGLGAGAAFFATALVTGECLLGWWLLVRARRLRPVARAPARRARLSRLRRVRRPGRGRPRPVRLALGPGRRDLVGPTDGRVGRRSRRSGRHPRRRAGDLDVARARHAAPARAARRAGGDGAHDARRRVVRVQRAPRRR